MQQRILPFGTLADRHPGITRHIGNAFAEAARVCLDRHHTSPAEISLQGTQASFMAVAQWDVTDARTRGAWANEIDTTEMGAYGLALAAIELLVGLVAVRRAETGTGADYYIAAPGVSEEDLEATVRLEISGVDKGDHAAVMSRLRQKVNQALAGASNLPALASVVGFRAKLIAVAVAE